jgi:hypothetical protein
VPVLLLLVVLSLGSAGALSAQRAPVVEAGSRVRLLLQTDRIADRGDPQQLRGVVREITTDTIRLQIHGQIAPIAVPTAWITDVHLSLGRATVWQGAAQSGWTGLLLGAGVGAAIGAEVANATDEPFLRTVLVRAGLYGVSLGATGAAVGALQPGERWRRVEIRARPTAAATGAAGVVLGLRW